MRQDNRVHIGVAEAEIIQEQDRLYSIVCVAESHPVSSYTVTRDPEEELDPDSGALLARSDESEPERGATLARSGQIRDTHSDLEYDSNEGTTSIQEISSDPKGTERGAWLARSVPDEPESGAMLARSGSSASTERGAAHARSVEDAPGGGAPLAHPETVRKTLSWENRNTRRRNQFEGKGKAREISISPPRAIPRKEARRLERKQGIPRPTPQPVTSTLEDG